MLNIDLFYAYMGVHSCGGLVGVESLFHHVNSRNQAEVVRHGGGCLCLLSCLTGQSMGGGNGAVEMENTYRLFVTLSRSAQIILPSVYPDLSVCGRHSLDGVLRSDTNGSAQGLLRRAVPRAHLSSRGCYL